MNDFKIGDIVSRKTYNGDIVFKIAEILEKEGKTLFVLKGINVRLEADAEGDDLDLIENDGIDT